MEVSMYFSATSTSVANFLTWKICKKKTPSLTMSFGMRIFLFQLCEVEKVTITDVKKTLNLVETALKNQKPPRMSK